MPGLHYRPALAGLLLLPAMAAAQSMTEYTAISFAGSSGGNVVISWPAVPKATTYFVHRTKDGDPCCDWTVKLAGSTLSTTDALPSQGTYQYSVSATNLRTTLITVEATYYYAILDVPPINRTRLSIMTPCTTASTAGAYPPSSVSVQAYGPTKAQISWPAVANAVAYKVQRSIDETTWYDLGCFGSTQLLFTDVTRTDVSPDVTLWPARSYAFRVTAYQSSGASGWNSMRVYMPGIQNPSGLTATRTGNMVKLCWYAPSQKPASYVITSSYGTSVNYSSTFPSSPICRDVLGVPSGTQTFRVGSSYIATPTSLETPVASRPTVTVTVP